MRPSLYQWLFWLEGTVTVCVGIAAAMILPDWPSTSKFLTEEERALAVKRLAIEVGQSDEEQVGFLKACKMTFTDYKVWLFCLAMYCHNTSFSFTSYFPTSKSNSRGDNPWLCLTDGFQSSRHSGMALPRLSFSLPLPGSSVPF
jgi:hypothetical protein